MRTIEIVMDGTENPAYLMSYLRGDLLECEVMVQFPDGETIYGEWLKVTRDWWDKKQKFNQILIEGFGWRTIEHGTQIRRKTSKLADQRPHNDNFFTSPSKLRTLEIELDGNEDSAQCYLYDLFRCKVIVEFPPDGKIIYGSWAGATRQTHKNAKLEIWISGFKWNTVIPGTRITRLDF